VTELRCREIKSAAYIETIIHFAETLLGIRLKNVKKNRYIRQYRTIILVEGIFDYFAFYNLLQKQDKPLVVSTLGSYLTPAAANILEGLDVEHFIVAFNWDEGGRNGIERIAAKLGGWVYYLGGLAEGQDPYDMLKPVVNAISGFSLKHLKTDAQCAGRVKN